jgi:phage-related protein (TIGR01555 family)
MVMWPFSRKQKRTDSSIDLNHADGWQSILTGLGVAAHDKRLSGNFAADIVSIEQAIALWRGDDLAARMIEVWPSEMLRQGYEITIATGDSDAPEATATALEDLGLDAKLWRAMAYERGYGGGAVLMGANDSQELDQPLKVESVREFTYLTALEPQELTPHKYYCNPLAPKYNEIATYLLQPTQRGLAYDPMNEANILTQTEVHESRLLIFPGIVVSKDQASMYAGWGDSILTRAHSVLRDFNMGFGAASILLHDFAQAIFKMKGLAEMIALNDGDAVKNRIKAVELSRSTARAVLIDAEEEFERKQTPLSGLPELLDRLATRLAAAADMPLTLLLGQSPAGLNATGDSDIRFFYDRVAAKQTNLLKPQLLKVIKPMFQLHGGNPDDCGVQFNPLYQQTEGEIASARKTQAETDSIYIRESVLSSEEVARSRFGGDEFSYETNVDWDEREKLEQEEAEALENDPFAQQQQAPLPPELEENELKPGEKLEPEPEPGDDDEQE